MGRREVAGSDSDGPRHGHVRNWKMRPPKPWRLVARFPPAVADSNGTACRPLPKQQIVGGECGVLFDTCYPTGVQAA